MTTANESFQKIDHIFRSTRTLVVGWDAFERFAVERFVAVVFLPDDFFAGVFLSAIEFAIGQLILQGYILHNSAILTPAKLTVT